MFYDSNIQTEARARGGLIGLYQSATTGTRWVLRKVGKRALHPAVTITVSQITISVNCHQGQTKRGCVKPAALTQPYPTPPR